MTTGWKLQGEVAARLGVSPHRLDRLMRVTPAEVYRPWVEMAMRGQARYRWEPDTRLHDAWFAIVKGLVDAKLIPPGPPMSDKRKRDRARRRGMASVAWIVMWWSSRMSVQHGACFACRRKARLDRAHIVPLGAGGSNEPENLHMLCKSCHHASERLAGEVYQDWFDRKRAEWPL